MVNKLEKLSCENKRDNLIKKIAMRLWEDKELGKYVDGVGFHNYEKYSKDEDFYITVSINKNTPLSKRDKLYFKVRKDNPGIPFEFLYPR